MPDASSRRGLIDTSVMIALDSLGEEALPAEIAVSAMTLAELAAARMPAMTPSSGHAVRSACS